MKHIPFIICLLLAASPGLLVATLPVWAAKETNITTVPKSQLVVCDYSNTWMATDDYRTSGHPLCWEV
jgi:hypothetical protein